MAFSKAMPKAFHVTLFNGSCDNDEEQHIFICRVSVVQLLAKQLCVVLSCHMHTCKILQAAQHCANLQSAII